MRKIIILFVFLINAMIGRANMSNSIELNQLYIVGSATVSAWDLGSAPEMEKLAPGIFEWTGTLKGNEEFKFMNTRESWHKHIVSAIDGVVAEIGKDYPLSFYANWVLDGSLDHKFKVAKSGEYTVTVDLMSMRVVISNPKEKINWPQKFFLYGSATGNEVIEIPEYYNVEHKKTVRLTQGFVKFIDTPTVTEKTNYYVPQFEEVDISYGQGYAVFLCLRTKDSNGWSVSVNDDYMIYIDNSRHTLSCKRFKQYNTLYLVGGCCKKGWDYMDVDNNQFYQDPENPDIMVWEGELRIGWDSKINADGTISSPPEPNKFKILTAQDWFRDTFHPYKADVLVEGESDARISGGDDLKWTIQKDGFYRLELNTKTEKLNARCIEIYDNEHLNDTNIASGQPTLLENEYDDKVVYYNLQGIQLKEPQTGLFIEKNGGQAKLILKK